jgi:hypothetical protein
MNTGGDHEAEKSDIYAVKPLDWRSLQGPRILHFTLGEKEPRTFQEWQELKLEANG